MSAPSRQTVSVIICTRNRAESLRLTLESFHALSIPEDLTTELVVVDNGSTDHTREVVETAGLSHVAVRYVLEPRLGQARARNRGIEQSTGGIVIYTDDDVRPRSGWIVGMCEPILAGRADAVRGGVRLAAELTRPWMGPAHRQWLASCEPCDLPFPDLVGANMAISRKVFEVVPAFDPDLGPGAAGFCDDTLFSRQLVEAGFRVESAMGAWVEHHFDPSRLLRRSFIQAARNHGRSGAYVAHHWAHEVHRRPWASYLRTAARLAVCRIRRLRRHRPMEGIEEWEMWMIKDLSFYRHYLSERGRARNYDRFGLRRLAPGGRHGRD